MPSREELQRIADAFSGKARTGGRRRRVEDILTYETKLAQTESPYEPKCPAGDRLRPPKWGQNPDAEEWCLERFEGLGATLVDALGIKSKGWVNQEKKHPPRPSPKGGSMTRQRRR